MLDWLEQRSPIPTDWSRASVTEKVDGSNTTMTSLRFCTDKKRSMTRWWLLMSLESLALFTTSFLVIVTYTSLTWYVANGALGLGLDFAASTWPINDGDNKVNNERTVPTMSALTRMDHFLLTMTDTPPYRRRHPTITR